MDYGVNHYQQLHHVDGCGLGRVVGENRLNVTVWSQNAEWTIAKKGTMDICVGDYVRLDSAATRIVEVYPREHVIHKSRNTTSKNWKQQTSEKVMASHVSDIFITIACDQRFTLGKLERYLLVFQQQGVRVRVLLTKSDLIEAADVIASEIHTVYPDVAVTRVSIYDDSSLNALRHHIRPESTTIFLGASGSGKSSLLNRLVDTQQRTNAVQSNGKGKHTTTETRLLASSDLGAYFIDTPGFKGIDTTGDYQGEVLFQPIEELAQLCRLSDCRHQTEPGCAVRQAIQEGRLDEQLLTRYCRYRRKMPHHKR